MRGVRTFVDEGLGHSSYVIDLGDGSAALVDPPRFASEQLAAIRSIGAAPRWTADTHAHADYVTGSPGLVSAHGVTFVAPSASRLETPHHGVADDEVVALAAGVSLRAIATPGHTPDHHVYVLERGGVPEVLFTGGSLMVGAVRRTDLCGPDLAEPLAREMSRSLRRLDRFPDDVLVCPTHGAGSFCAAPGRVDRTSTLRRERATNAMFGIGDEDLFVEELLAGFGTFPTYFAHLPELNRLGPRHHPQLPNLEPIDADTVRRRVAEGAVIVDTRPIAEFATGHIAGSVSNGFRPAFASWLAWTVELDRPIVIVAGEGQDRDEIIRQCLEVGHDAVVGELDGGIDAWRAAGGAITTIPLVGPTEIAARVLDVRQRSEYDSGHLPGAINVELGSIGAGSVGAGISPGPVTVMCGHGERAMTAASLLACVGHCEVTVFDGGPATWRTATGRPLEGG